MICSLDEFCSKTFSLFKRNQFSFSGLSKTSPASLNKSVAGLAEIDGAAQEGEEVRMC